MQRNHSLRGVVLVASLVVFLGSWALASDLDSGSGAPVGSGAVKGEGAPESPQPDEVEVVGAPVPTPVSSGLTWQFFSREDCFDHFQQSCSVNFPQPQCAPNPAGQPCSPHGAECFRTVSSSKFDHYICMD